MVIPPKDRPTISVVISEVEMNDEPKSPAEMKEIRLNRKRTQEVEGIKAMAEIAAADIAIRQRTEKLRALRLAKEAGTVTIRRNRRSSPKRKPELRKRLT